MGDLEIYIDIGLIFTYVVGGLAVLASLVVFPILSIIDSPKSFIKPLYFIGGVVVVFGLSYALAGSKVFPQWETYGITSGDSKLIGAGLLTFYILIGLAFAGIVYSEINKVLK